MVPEDVKQYIGKMDPPSVRGVEKGAIRRYADAVGNDNPLYYDEAYASKSRYGSIIAPPGFFGWPTKPARSSAGLSEGIVTLQTALSKVGFSRILDGGISYDFYLPVRAGDVLVASLKIKDITEKEGKSGTLVICNFETTYLNQNGDLVAKAYQTFIAR